MLVKALYVLRVRANLSCRGRMLPKAFRNARGSPRLLDERRERGVRRSSMALRRQVGTSKLTGEGKSFIKR